MTAEELERIAKFVKAVNAAEFEFSVRIDLAGSYEDKYIRIAAELAEKRLGVEPRLGGSDLELVRPDDDPWWSRSRPEKKP